MPRFFSSSIQSDVVARWFLRAVTEPASCTAPPYRRRFWISLAMLTTERRRISEKSIGTSREKSLKFRFHFFGKCLGSRRPTSSSENVQNMGRHPKLLEVVSLLLVVLVGANGCMTQG